MVIQCSKCPVYVCRTGDREHGPDTCPMHHDFPEAEKLYASPEIRRMARTAAIIEAAGYRRWTRAEEIMEFARLMGFRKLGVAYCHDMTHIGELYVEVLKKNGFEVVAAGKVRKECEPQAQAELCNKQGTELNVMLGMCVGHDSIFIKNSQAWVTALVAKDNFLLHNPVGAIYGAKGYFAETLKQHKTGPAGQQSVELTPAQLAEAAQEIVQDGNGRWTRLEETMEFARKLNVTRLGLIFCAGFRYEAETLTGILEQNGFEVVSVSCKTGAVPKRWIGVAVSEEVNPAKPGMMCNPLAQAELLNRNNTGLNILMGQCVGHDSLSMKHSRAPVVCLVAKDRVLSHNTAAALYDLNYRTKLMRA